MGAVLDHNHRAGGPDEFGNLIEDLTGISDDNIDARMRKDALVDELRAQLNADHTRMTEQLAPVCKHQLTRRRTPRSRRWLPVAPCGSIPGISMHRSVTFGLAHPYRCSAERYGVA